MDGQREIDTYCVVQINSEWRVARKQVTFRAAESIDSNQDMDVFASTESPSDGHIPKL